MANARPGEATKTDWLLVALLVLPLAVALAKLPVLPTSDFALRFFSLAFVPVDFHAIAENLLMVPLGALVVVIFRLTLGLRVLGMFRPILIAMAFQVIGVPISVAFLLLALVVIIVLRPLLQTDHNYARLGVLLSLASTLLFAPLLAGQWWDIAWLREIAFFPSVALCLTCESFAKVLDRDGICEAAWRTVTTVSAAVVIVALTSLPGVLPFFLRFPEALLVEASCILLINKHLSLRLFEGANPLAVPLARRWMPPDTRLPSDATASAPELSK
jgi:hypothetical protein